MFYPANKNALSCQFLFEHKCWKRISLVLGIVLFSSNLLIAQEVWSLDDCLNYSRKNNVQIQQSRFEKEKVRLQYAAAKRRYLPEIDARLRSVSNYGFLIDPSTNLLNRNLNFGNQMSLNGNWDLLNGSVTRPLRKQRFYELAAAQFDYETITNITTLDIIYLYLQVLLTNEQVNNARQSVLLLNKMEAQIKRQVKVYCINVIY